MKPIKKKKLSVNIIEKFAFINDLQKAKHETI